MLRKILLAAVLATATTGPVLAGSILQDPDQQHVYVAQWSRLRHLADLGDTTSQFQLANLYYDPPEGSALPQSYTKAARYYRKAAMRNHAASQHNLGVLYLKGLGVDRDWVQAYAWFSLSADQGYRAAKDAVTALGTRLDEADKTRAEQAKLELKDDIR